VNAALLRACAPANRAHPISTKFAPVPIGSAMTNEILFFQRGPAKDARMQEKRIHQIFVASVLFKGIHALIEIVGGIALYLISTATIVQTIQRYSYDELIEDKDDWVATQLLQFAQTFSVAEHNFYAFYLLSHGLIKSVLVIGLLREKLWAYPASFAVFGAFIAYQLYRFTFTHDIGLILLSIFDLFVIYLAVHEYRLLRKHLPTH
jgi:uncharacterized membrane protein